MKHLLFIGHTYHQKTKSADFVLEMLEEKYDVQKFYINPDKDTINKFSTLNGAKFDIIVLWQIMPNIDELKSYISAEHWVFFPMYDGVYNKGISYWRPYKKVKIINFSKTLHERLSNIGLDSHYIQYFPKPKDDFIIGDDKTIYFWQRVTSINISIVEKLFSEIEFNKIHIHKVIDPNQKFIEPSYKISSKVEYSTWYDRREDMQKDIQSAQIYIAPRLYEGIGMSFLEAMAMGRCVIAPNYPTMNEYIEDRKTGILYNFDKITSLDKFNAKKIGKKAFEYIKKGYKKWETEKYKILEWLEEPIILNESKFRKVLEINEYKLFGFLPIITIEKNFLDTRIFILNYFLFLVIKSEDKKK